MFANNREKEKCDAILVNVLLRTNTTKSVCMCTKINSLLFSFSFFYLNKKVSNFVVSSFCFKVSHVLEVEEKKT